MAVDIFGVSMLNSIFRISKKNDFAESFGIRNQFAVCGRWEMICQLRQRKCEREREGREEGEKTQNDA